MEKLEIPADVKTRFEFINGIGIKEGIITMIAFAISVVIGLIYKAIMGSFIGMIVIIFIITSGTFIMIMKDKNKQSVAEIIGNMIEFFKHQTFFEYKVNENIYYKGEIINEKEE